MGSSEADTSTKNHKTSSAQDQPSSGSPAAVYNAWASFPAYYNVGGTAQIAPTGFFHSPMASNLQGHPYVWTPQMISPYVAMYPPGGLYPHLSMPTVTSVDAAEMNGTLTEGKGKSPLMRSKGSLGSLTMETGKANDIGIASANNGCFSQSGESGSEGSSEGSDMISQIGSQQKQGDQHGSGDEVQNGSVAGSASNGVTKSPYAPSVVTRTMPLMAIPPGGIAGPTTTLNIGMECWGGLSNNSIPITQGKLPVTPSTSAVVPSSLADSSDGVPSDSLDERELRRQKRKQSNRESARRSRLRKQAEGEELAQRVVALQEENDSLKEEMRRVQRDCERLAFENSFLDEKLRKHEV